MVRCHLIFKTAYVCNQGIQAITLGEEHKLGTAYINCIGLRSGLDKKKMPARLGWLSLGIGSGQAEKCNLRCSLFFKTNIN